MNNKIKIYFKKPGEHTYSEVIDGVTVYYNGRITERGNPNVDMYDANGNQFYSNFSSLEDAKKSIIELAENGITAVIGPKAPCHGRNGRMMPNPFENYVGVYIVEQKEKTEDAPVHGLR